MSTQIDDLKIEFALLRSRVEQIEQSQAGNATPAPHELPVVQEISREVFGVNPVFKVEQELEGEGAYVVVEVPVSGTPEENHHKSMAWHKKIAAHRPRLSSYALSLRHQ